MIEGGCARMTIAATTSHRREEPGRVRIEAERVHVVADMAMPDPSVMPFSRESFEQTVTVDVKKIGKNYIEFDLVGVAPALANALRRVIISEIATMAIETVFVVNNTSIIPDEVFAHRLGLIPIYADPRKFSFSQSPSGDAADPNTIVFELRERCQAIKGSAKEAPLEEKTVNSSVYSRSIKWIPHGAQEEDAALMADPIRPLLDDILLVKMRPGQEVDIDLHCIKGLGKDHAKWSPVSRASYRLLPRITITEPILGEDAEKFAKCFSPSVISVVTKKNGTKEAVVASARDDTVSRECLRHAEFANKVVLSRVHDHFICKTRCLHATPLLPLCSRL